MQSDTVLLPEAFRDQIICGDALSVMQQLPAGCIDLVVTSPPYNLRAGRSRHPNRPGDRAYSEVILKGYANYSDDLPYADYVAWQRTCLHEMFRLLPEHGAIFYNHKWRIQRGVLQDHRAIFDGLPVRQVIVWKRPGGVNFTSSFFLPTYEVIYLIAKPRFRLAPKANALGDVWALTPEHHSSHPAPFPLALPRRIIGATNARTVLDPFMGSGTTALAARQLGRTFVGIDHSPRYCEMARARVRHEGAPSNQRGAAFTQ